MGGETKEGEEWEGRRKEEERETEEERRRERDNVRWKGNERGRRGLMEGGRENRGRWKRREEGLKRKAKSEGKQKEWGEGE